MNTCAQCDPGFTVTPIMQGTQSYGANCVQTTAPVNSGITNCVSYGPMVYGTSELQIGCINCQSGFINVGGFCVANLTQANYTCNIQNCVYCISNNICGQCAQGYNVYMGTNYQCTKNYSPIPNCLLTPIFAPVCQLCATNYVLVNGACVLP